MASEIIAATFNIRRDPDTFENFISYLQKFKEDVVFCVQEDLDDQMPKARNLNPTRLKCMGIAAKYGFSPCSDQSSRNRDVPILYATKSIHSRIKQEQSNSTHHVKFYLTTGRVRKLWLVGIHAPSLLYPEENRRYLQQNLRQEIDSCNARDSIVALGDFNSNPFSESISSIYGLNAKLTQDDAKRLCNPMWQYGMLKVTHTYEYYNKHAITRYNIFDQVLLSKGLATSVSIAVIENGVTFNGNTFNGLLNSDHKPVICKFAI